MRNRIDQVIADHSIEALPSVLADARVSDVRYAARRLAEVHGGRTPELTRNLAAHSDPAARVVAVFLAENSYPTEGDASIEALRSLAGDEDWTVRDAAAEACGRLLRNDFSKMLAALHGWRTDEREGVRRAVAVAACRSAQRSHLEWAEPLLKLVGPLLEDRTESVRRSLGPSALAVSLLRHYPDATFEYLVTWSTSNDAQVLWNVAMALSGQPASKMVKKALIVLRKLSLDERRYVWRAVASAMWKLGRRRPEIVRPELARWIDDERRIDVARQALKHI